MTLSELCIRRPVMTTLITASIIAFGLFGFRLLPVSALPKVDFPTIAVTATLPGASADTMAASVAGIIERHDFREGRARYEQMPESHHDHLINLRDGKVIEFTSEEIEKLQAEIARKLGYKLVDHRLELYCVPLDDDSKS